MFKLIKISYLRIVLTKHHAVVIGNGNKLCTSTHYQCEKYSKDNYTPWIVRDKLSVASQYFLIHSALIRTLQDLTNSLVFPFGIKGLQSMIFPLNGAVSTYQLEVSSE